MRIHRRYEFSIASATISPDSNHAKDFSNYWTATMYFKHQNGSYKRVSIYPNAQLGQSIQFKPTDEEHTLTHPGYEGQDAANINGGMTIYYTQKDFNSSDLEHYTTAFPPVNLPSFPPHPN